MDLFERIKKLFKKEHIYYKAIYDDNNDDIGIAFNDDDQLFGAIHVFNNYGFEYDVNYHYGTITLYYNDHNCYDNIKVKNKGFGDPAYGLSKDDMSEHDWNTYPRDKWLTRKQWNTFIINADNHYWGDWTVLVEGADEKDIKLIDIKLCKGEN